MRFADLWSQRSLVALNDLDASVATEAASKIDSEADLLSRLQETRVIHNLLIPL